MSWSPSSSGAMRRLGLSLVALVVGASVPAFAAEPSGCDKFAWAITGEQQLLAAPQSVDLAGPLSRAMTTAIEVPLAASAEAKLAMPPERAPKNAGSFAGMVLFQPLSRHAFGGRLDRRYPGRPLPEADRLQRCFGLSVCPPERQVPGRRGSVHRPGQRRRGEHNCDSAHAQQLARLVGLKVHRDAVDTVAQMRGRWAVVEDMTEMAATIGAVALGTHHAVAAIA